MLEGLRNKHNHRRSFKYEVKVQDMTDSHILACMRIVGEDVPSGICTEGSGRNRRIDLIKLLIGGSPCTHWSIAKPSSREILPSGKGWELFENFKIAKEKFQPDFFFYENNWSASAAIKEQIQNELGCPLMRINSSLVSAQMRDRFYVFNWNVPPPQDRQIELKDVLESGFAFGASREKAYCLTATYYKGYPPAATLRRKERSLVAEPIRIGTVENSGKNQAEYDSKPYKVYSPYGKAVTIMGEAGSVGAKTGLYAVPARYENKPVYQVRSGMVEIKGVLYPIQLPDGDYIIRKLTPIECERLQTLPDNYTQGVSNTQRYRGLGNGWTAEVVIHCLRGVLDAVPRGEKLVILSMYDGIGTGMYCLDKMGFTNVEYHAYEIDKYAAYVASKNYPSIIQHGDAYQIRSLNWSL